MKGFLKKNLEAILVLIALCLLGTTIAFYFWGIGTIIESVDIALSASQSSSATSTFNFTDAHDALVRHGLLSQ